MSTSSSCLVARANEEDVGPVLGGTILRYGMRAYQRALVRVQKGLLKITPGNRKLDLSEEYLPLSCMACALTELMANRLMESASWRLHDIGRLIEKCGIASYHPTCTLYTMNIGASMQRCALWTDIRASIPRNNGWASL